MTSKRHRKGGVRASGDGPARVRIQYRGGRVRTLVDRTGSADLVERLFQRGDTGHGNVAVTVEFATEAIDQFLQSEHAR